MQQQIEWYKVLKVFKIFKWKDKNYSSTTKSSEDTKEGDQENEMLKENMESNNCYN